MARVNLNGNYLSIYFGNTRRTADVLTADPFGDDHIFYFPYYPVSTRKLWIQGYYGGSWHWILNYQIEPLNGKLTVAAHLPAYTQVKANYFRYVNYELDILTKNFKPIPRTPQADIDCWNQAHYTIHNFYPDRLEFGIVGTRESQRALFTEAMFFAYYFIIIDKGIPQEYAMRAYEGPLFSEEQLSMYKGYSNVMPSTCYIQEFGKYTPEILKRISSFQNPGGGKTNVVVPLHGLVAGETIVIYGSTHYNGTYQVDAIVDENVITIDTAYVADDTGWCRRNDYITWNFWKNT